jgi:hypothetical protein
MVGPGGGREPICPPTPPWAPPQAETSPAATGSKPHEKIDHTVGPYPRIDYAPGTVSDPPPLSVGDVHDFHASPATTIDPGSTADIGDLGPVDQGIEPIIPEGPSGVLPKLLLLSDDDLPPHTDLDATVAIGDEQVPWQAVSGDIPKMQTTPFMQVPMDLGGG